MVSLIGDAEVLRVKIGSEYLFDSVIFFDLTVGSFFNVYESFRTFYDLE